MNSELLPVSHVEVLKIGRLHIGIGTIGGLGASGVASQIND